MPEVRKENGNDLEYVCPECGDTFEEGAEECASCGLEFDWSEEMEYLCPECGTIVDPDQSRCPGCSAKFSTDEHGDVIIEYEPEEAPPSVEELLDTAIDEVMVRPNGSIEIPESAPVEEPPVEPPRNLAPKKPTKTVQIVKKPPHASGLEGRPIASKKSAREPSTPSTPRLYPGGFTRMGMVFVVLAFLSIVFTVVMARYDTWIQGAAEESMGDNQRMLFIGGLITFSISIIVAIYDLLRTPRGIEETPA
jgi:RNA polymerase subunit RPABC4/transcription elongation factor Spt4